MNRLRLALARWLIRLAHAIEGECGARFTASGRRIMGLAESAAVDLPYPPEPDEVNPDSLGGRVLAAARAGVRLAEGASMRELNAELEAELLNERAPCPACGATAGPVTISGGAKGERNKPQCARCGTPWEGGA